MDAHLKRLNADPSTYDQLSEYPVRGTSRDDHYDRMLQFLCTVGQLKTLDRTGWILEGREIAKPESVAGHMYRMAIIAMLLKDDGHNVDGNDGNHHMINGNMTNGCENGEKLLSTSTSPGSVAVVEPSKKKLNFDKVIQMSLIHDIAECIVGDITPYDGVTEEEKHHREQVAMDHLVGKLSPGTSKYFTTLYDEYERRRTPEALLVKELDRFDVMLQAFQYERAEYLREKRVVRFDTFFRIASEHCKHAKLSALTQRIIAERERFWHEVIVPQSGDGKPLPPDARTD